MRDDDEIVEYREASDPSGHVLAMLIYLLSLAAPILAPLIIWLMGRGGSDFVDFHGKQYFNFFISYTIYAIVASILIFVGIGLVLAPLVGLLAFIFTIVAAVKSYRGEEYIIPLSIQFIRP